MNQEFVNIPEFKMVTLPSPSGEYLRSLFNVNHKTFGLKPQFLSFLENNNYSNAITLAKQTFEQKQLAKAKAMQKGEDHTKIKVERFPNSDRNYPALFRIEEYKKAFSILKPCIENQ